MKQEKTHPSNTWRHPGGKLIEEGAKSKQNNGTHRRILP
jgi:hypothetical protein